MSATKGFQSEVVRHILLNETIANIGDTTGLPASAADGDLYLCLLKQDPGEDGDLTNEATYGGYARIAISRTDGWTEVDGYAYNAANATFPECTSGSEDLTHFGVCKTLAGDDMMFHGELPAPFPISQEMQPRYEPGQLAIRLD